MNSNTANNYSAFIPADAVLIDNGDSNTTTSTIYAAQHSNLNDINSTTFTSNNNNNNNNNNNTSNNGILNGQIVPSVSSQPPTSYGSLPTATMVPSSSSSNNNLGNKPFSRPSHHSGPTQQQGYQYQHQHQQQGHATVPNQHGAYSYATSVAGQPVLVSISPISNNNNNNNNNNGGRVDPSLSAAHHEHPLSKAIRRRNRRHRRVAVGAAAGIVTGAVLLGPFGLLLGYAAGTTIGLTSAVSGERRKDRRLAREREAVSGSRRSLL